MGGLRFLTLPVEVVMVFSNSTGGGQVFLLIFMMKLPAS